MDSTLLTALNSAAGEVDSLIGGSTFPEQVKVPYLARAMRSYPENGGKRLRPAIMLWSAAAAGGEMRNSLHAAAALEVFHNWTLVHDDIIDDDDFRRNSPTAHIMLADFVPTGQSDRRSKFGCDMAILAGDLMQAWAFDFIQQSAGLSAEIQLKLASELRNYGYIKLVSGEALDVEMSCRDVADISEAELQEMQILKTGALLHYAARAGWMIGRNSADAWDEPEALALGEYGDNLALAFQLRDDYLGIFGEQSKFGKPIGSDLQEAKATLLLIHALNHLPPDARVRLQSLLRCENYTDEMIAAARELFMRSGSIDYLQRSIDLYTSEALRALEKITPSPWRDLLEKLALYLVNREK